MRTETYEIVIPEKCRVMTEEEIEYEGGVAWIPVTAAISIITGVASVACSIMADHDKGNSDTWKKVGGTCSIISAATGYASGVGFIGTYSSGAIKAVATSSSAGSGVLAVKMIARAGSAASNVSFGLSYKIASGIRSLFGI